MIERIAGFSTFDVATTFSFAEYSRTVEQQFYRLHEMVDHVVQGLLREQAGSHGALAAIMYDRCIALLGGTAEMSDPEQQKEQLCRVIREQLQSGKFVEGCEAAIRGIHQFPGEDRFVRCLVDAYLAREAYAEGQLFRNSFPLLCRYFAKQSCYPKIGITREDALQIMIDLFDYGMRASVPVLAIFTEFFSRIPMGREILAVGSSFFEEKVALVEEYLRTIKKEERALEGLLTGPEVLEEHAFDEMQRRLLCLSSELVGGRDASVPIGLKKYVQGLNTLFACFMGRFEPSEGAHPLLQEMSCRLEVHLTEIHASLRHLFCDGERPGLRALAERRRNRRAPLIEEDAEPSVAEWARRQNLIDAIAAQLVPRQAQDQVVSFLETQGICLDQLFATDLARSMPEVRVASSQEGFSCLLEEISRRGIASISDLCAYITR